MPKHQPTIKVTIKSETGVSLKNNYLEKLSTDYQSVWRSLFLVKFHAFWIFKIISPSLESPFLPFFTQSHEQFSVLPPNLNCLSKISSIANLFDTNIRKFDAKKTIFLPRMPRRCKSGKINLSLCPLFF